MKTKIPLRSFIVAVAAILVAICALTLYVIVPDVSLNSFGLWMFVLVVLVVATVIVTRYYRDCRRAVQWIWMVLLLYVTVLLILTLLGVLV